MRLFILLYCVPFFDDDDVINVLEAQCSDMWIVNDVDESHWDYVYLQGTEIVKRVSLNLPHWQFVVFSLNYYLTTNSKLEMMLNIYYLRQD